MTFDEVLDQVRELLQQRGRVTYRALQRRFTLDDEYLEDLKGELIKAERVAADEAGEVLVWVGASPVSSSTLQVSSSPSPAPSPQLLDSSQLRTLNSELISGERRQMTVKFIDLVGSTALSEQLDPEELRKVLQEYRATCASVIRRFAGYLAKYIGDGLLVYFGYPQAHEDDAQRAVRAGLGIVAALPQLNAELQSTLGAHGCAPLQVRIGIHTGLVVAGEMGTEDQPEPLAIVGETPNIAARVQGQAEPNTVVISQATYRLVQGLFECQELGPQMLKGLSTPMALYRVEGEGTAQSRFAVAVQKGLTPLVGRESELGFLQQHWEQAKAGAGQVVLVSGDPGIGKSRLVQEFTEQLKHEGVTRLEFRCSPYHHNSAFYPIIEHLQRLLQFERDDTPQAKLTKLQQALVAYHFPQADTFPLLAALLSLPQPEGYPPLTLSPQKQTQRTHEALVAWIVEEAERAPVSCVWEDLQWADPSTLEVLTLYLEQIPTTRIFTMLTFRSDFTPPWGSRSYLTPLTLSRLGHRQVREMVGYVAARTSRPSTSSGRTESAASGEGLPVRAEPVEARTALPDDLIDAVVARTDGVPLFVEELTKSVVESVGAHGRAPLQSLDIPATLQDSLMARLDRLGPAKEIAQLGATLGREFSYDLLQAVSPLDEERLQQGLKQLVAAELVYQRGLVPQAYYLFKHALIQDTAYQSLLKSTRQQYHTKIAQVLDKRFPETKEAQPELLAHHYTEAGLKEQATVYWQRAGQRAVARSANREAISHLTRGLELLKTLPDTSERAQHELTLQLALGTPLMVTKGWATPEVERAYTRARELCQQVGETSQLFPALWGLWMFYFIRAELQTARELGEQLLSLAQSVQDPALVLEGHHALWPVLCFLGELAPTRVHLEQGLALYDLQQHGSLAFFYGGHDPGACCRYFAGVALWLMGYPDQALKKSHEALTLAQEVSHPYSLAMALDFATRLHQFRREWPAVQERAEAMIALSSEQGFALTFAWGTIMRGWVLAEQGQGEEGIAQMRQGLAACRATGAELTRPFYLTLLAEAYGKVGQVEEGLQVLAEALDAVDKSGERFCEAELYRLKGELTLAQSSVQSLGASVQTEAAACFLKAIEVARKQQAKSWELRAAMSLARLWQQQDKKDEARQMLAEIYGWFTEGFDTKDLQEAKALLEELSH